MRTSGYCEGAYRWLDDYHLLLYPVTGEDASTVGTIQQTLPVVMNLSDGKSWAPATNGPDYDCDLALWSESMHVLISNQGREILLYASDGAILRRYLGSRPISLSPSGQRLMAGFAWVDLRSGQTVDFSGQYNRPMYNPAWSFDEMRLFECCFYYADAKSGQYGPITLDSLEGAGRDMFLQGPQSRWVVNSTRVAIEWDFYADNMSVQPVIPLINPETRTYEDIRAVAGLEAGLPCAVPIEGPPYYDAARIAPNGDHFWVGCEAVSYIVNLTTYFTQTIPGDLQFVSWSPDSQFALLGRSKDRETQHGEFMLLPVSSDDLYPVADGFVAWPTWDPSGRYLAFLASDGKALIALDMATRETTQAPLPYHSIQVYWRPQGDGLAVLASDGSLWWTPDPATDYVEQLTPPQPEVRDVHWSPDGSRLAFVSGMDVYIVSVARSKLELAV